MVTNGTAPAQSAPPPATVVSILLEAADIHRQERFAAVLGAAVATARRLNSPLYLGSLMRDSGTKGWHLTTLLDPGGRLATLSYLGVPLGPFPFQMPDEIEPQPLASLLGYAWGPANCAALEQRLQTTTAFCVPVLGDATLRGALLALLPSVEAADVAIAIAAHASIAGARHLDEGNVPHGDGVLDPGSLVNRAESEIARAKRYRRPLAVVVYELDEPADVARVGAALAHRLRNWDIIGQLPGDKPCLCVVLPETSRVGALGLISRFNRDLPGLRVGAAVLPEDDDGLAGLAQSARARAAYGARRPLEAAQTPADEHSWVRGAPAGPGAETVRCPICSMPYTRFIASNLSKDVLERSRAAALALLRVDCPNHPSQIVAESTAERRRGLFDRLKG